MIIESIHVKNFRSIYDERISCERLTALVGANGSGKSSFLYALRDFYSGSPTISLDDFYNQNGLDEICISITFKELSTEAEKQFSEYLQNNILTVERIFKLSDTGKIISAYHGSTLQNPEFEGIKNAFEIKDSGKTAKIVYDELKKNLKYSSLPGWVKTLRQNKENMGKWESDHPQDCVRIRDNGQFFDFNEGSQGNLGRFSRLLFIPAIKDASEEAYESKNSILTKLMDLVVRSVIAEKEEIKKLRIDTQKRYEELMDPKKIPELKTLSSQLTKTLNDYIPDSKIDLKWVPLGQINIPPPTAELKLSEDGYSSTVDRTGHGIQRAFILTILQHLAIIQSKLSLAKKEITEMPPGAGHTSVAGKNELPNLILAIEEPELYQHPNRQRHFAKVLSQLAQGSLPGVAEKTQIIYCTHSPLFVGIDRINEIRLLKKVNNGPKNPKKTIVVSTTLDRIAEIMCTVYPEPPGHFTGQNIIPRLKTIMTPWMNEGFFADVVILVEGEDDRAAILGMAHVNNQDLEAMGFAVIPCMGKTNIDRPYLIFSELGIPVYIIWDNDSGKGVTEGSCITCRRPLDKKINPLENRRLLRLIGSNKIEDWPCFIEENAACLEKDLESTLKREIGNDLYETLIRRYQDEFSISEKKNAQKNPVVIMNIIKAAKEQGKSCITLEAIVQKIWALKK